MGRELIMQLHGKLIRTAKANNASSAKIIGIHWYREYDTIYYLFCLTSNAKSTKQQVLSDVERIFDPLGILFQEIWRHDLGWHNPLPQKLVEWWNKSQQITTGTH